jgi:mevalonate kinase
MSEASAAAKLILFGEHAVVFGRPAIAIPLPNLRAHARVQPHPAGQPGQIEIVSEDLHTRLWLHEADMDDPLAAIVQLTLDNLAFRPDKALLVSVQSSIPVAAGLGSGASVSVAIARAIAATAGFELPPQDASSLAFEVERIHHGSPSGIDNTVIAYEQPVYFIRDHVLETFELRGVLNLVLADTGERVKTAQAVAGVHARYDANPSEYNKLFDQIGAITAEAHQVLMSGNYDGLGALMSRNQVLLGSIGVSSARLDALSKAAMKAGAQGAKLSGAGLGGYMMAMVEKGNSEVDP